MWYFSAKVLLRSRTGSDGDYNAMITLEELEFNVIAIDEKDAREQIAGYFSTARIEKLSGVPTGDGNRGLLFPRARTRIYSGLISDMPVKIRKRWEAS